MTNQNYPFISSRHNFTDKDGKLTTEAYRFLYNIYGVVGSGQAQITINNAGSAPANSSPAIGPVSNLDVSTNLDFVKRSILQPATSGYVDRLVFSSGPRLLPGSGTPYNNLSGAVGDIFIRVDGTSTQTLYVKETNTNSFRGWSPIIQPMGNCYLSLSGSNIILSPYQGNQLSIVSEGNVIIPSSGITISASGLAPGNFYYIYAYLNSGTLILETSLTSHTTDVNTGIEIKSGDTSRTLVGMGFVSAGPVFSIAASWFNQKLKGISSSILPGPYTTTSITAVEITPVANRLTFLIWAKSNVGVGVLGNFSSSLSTQTVSAYVAIDGAIGNVGQTSLTGTSNFNVMGTSNTLTEGSHYVSLFGAISGVATASFTYITNSFITMG